LRQLQLIARYFSVFGAEMFLLNNFTNFVRLRRTFCGVFSAAALRRQKRFGDYFSRRGEAPPEEIHLVKFFFLDLWIKFGKIIEKV